MKKEEWLRGEIAKWRSEGAVDAATADALLARYPVNESRIGWGAVIAGAFGALLVGLGIIAIFAANWDCLGRGARAAVAMAPLVACGVAAALAKAKDWRTMALWEPLGILWFVSTVAAACLVAQTYNIGGRVPDLVMFVAALTLPVVWITRSVAAMAMWPVLAIVYGCVSSGWRGVAPGAIAYALLMLAASVPAYVAFLRRRPPRAALVLGQFATGLVYSLGMAVMLVDCLDCGMRSGVLVFWVCSAVVFGIGAGLRLPVWPTTALVVATLAATPTVSPYSGDGMFALYLLALVLAVATTVCGVTKRRLTYMNIGATLLLYLILAKFFMSDVDFTVKGIVLIVSGVALAALNVVLVRAKRRA